MHPGHDNCNGTTDEGVTTTFYLDTDDDGFGNRDVTIEACSVPPGFVANAMDVDDNNPSWLYLDYDGNLIFLYRNGESP